MSTMAAPIFEMKMADTFAARHLDVEFERLAVLLKIVQRHREAKQAGAELKRTLAKVQEAVDKSRKQKFWAESFAECKEIFETPFGVDLLVASLFPLLRPAVAFTVNSLQNASEPVITQALLHELLLLRPREETALAKLLSPISPLLKNHLLRIEGSGPLRRIHPGAPLLRLFLAEGSYAELPGGMRLVHHSGVGIPELLVDEQTKTKLDEVVNLARHHRDINERNSALSVGGPAILFVGAPGTGKGLAARQLASQLDRPLFQLDLGGIVSKWVGETEKNLSRVFEQMSGTDGCILIDEADAILGKRVSIKEGRDHHANITVSHLLTLLENHQGVVILTSNLRANLDEAYTRRFAAVIEFKRPDFGLRKSIWEVSLRSCTTAQPKEKMAKLAASVELSAAEIKNSCHRALAFAYEDAEGLNYAHLALAVWREKTKSTLTFTMGDLRELQPFLEITL